MKSKIFVVLSTLLFLGSLFCITSCNDLLTSQSSTKTNVKINLDVSKLINNTRSAAVQQTKEYILKVFVYNTENYQPDTQIENLPLVAEAKSKVNANGIVSVSLQVPIDYSVFFVANLYELLDENTESTIPLYTGKSEIIKIKPEDNKVDLILSKSQADVDIDIDINTQSTYKVEHYQQNIEDDKYSLVETDTETKIGTIGTETEATAKSYDGFSVNPFEQKTILSDSSTTVKIYYTRNVYTVTFNANGGILNETNSQIVKYNGKSTEPTKPTKEGYNFAYWYTSKDNGVTEDISYNFLTPVTNNVTLYAMWIAGTDIVYKVEHYQQNIEDDEYSLVETDTETKKGTIGTQTEATAKSYEGFSVNPFEQKTILSNGSTTVKIYYTRNVYTVTFNANGGILSENSSQIVKYNGKSTEPTEPIKEGHLFQGWYTSEDYGTTFNDTTYDFEKEITENITLHAKWWNSSSFVYVKGATIQDGIKGSGYTESKIFVDGKNVSIQSFYMSDHEVTQAEYKAIMGTWPDEGTTDVDYGVGDLYPAYSVSWFDTLVYCNKRSMKENLTPCYTINGSTDPNDWGAVPKTDSDANFSDWFNATCDFQANGYRLPTSAEWEYAARGGNGLSNYQYKYAGSNDLDTVAWYWDNSNSSAHEVKLKQPNELYLYDMSGNIYEWCWDKSENSTELRYSRSGYWSNAGDEFCVSSMYPHTSTYRQHNIGFRLVRTADFVQGDVYSSGITLNGTTYAKTGEVVIIPAGTVAQIAMTDDSSWNTYYEGDEAWNKGVFLKDRKVQLSPFAMSQFEVTQELWFAIFGVNPSKFQSSENPPANGEVQNLRPVECITWYDAVNFCNELTKRTMGEEHCVYTITGTEKNDSGSIINATVTLDLSQTGYRLPTEAEWEFAARGGDPTKKEWKYAYAGVQSTIDKTNFVNYDGNTDTVLDTYGWYKNNANSSTHEVGKKLPNSLNLFDISGNVYEWCYDWYNDDVCINDSGDIVINPTGPLTGEIPIARGGCWSSAIYWASVSHRPANVKVGERDESLGLRLVRTITE